ARLLWEIHAELDKRLQGRSTHQVLGNLPVVGGYLGERSPLGEVAEAGSRWLRRRWHWSAPFTAAAWDRPAPAFWDLLRLRGGWRDTVSNRVRRFLGAWNKLLAGEQP